MRRWSAAVEAERARYAHLPKLPGVYLLTHCGTGDTYIGSSQCINKRVRQHVQDIRCGRCTSGGIWRVVNEHGIDFDAVVLEITTAEDRLVAERRWIEELAPTLNRWRIRKTKVWARTSWTNVR